jgi:hypothetical protein
MNPLESTIRAAETVLVSGGDIDACITAMDAYVAALNKLLKQLEKKTGDYAGEDVAPLEPLHQQVLAVAMQLLGNTSVDLRQLQAKGKAILAYTDTMPKRVSIRGKQKG